ncbi:MAG: radical SAM protein [Candidatus Omnitrophota bacterium]
MSKGILVSFSGYPYTPSSLMPDNGLANMAGALIEHGHKALIIDFGTVNTIKRLVPPLYSQILSDIYSSFQRKDKNVFLKKLNDLFLFIKLKAISAQLARIQEKEADKLALELIDLILKEKPSFIGFKLWIGDGFRLSVRMAEVIKKHFPDIKIFAGGPTVTMAEEAIYKVTQVFDAICYSEGEETIVELAEYSEGKRSLDTIDNVIYKDKDGIIKKNKIHRIEDLNKLPLPVYDDNVYPAMKGNQKIKVIVIDESRGCPNRCHFCPHSAISGQGWRVKSSGRIIKEIEMMTNRYNIHAFRYAGSCTPAKVIEEVAEGIIDKGLDVLYTSFAHVRTTDVTKLELLKRSGLYAFFFGIESGDKDILSKVMGKGISPDTIKDTMRASIEAGIFTVGSIIYPSPGETEESRKNTLKLLKDIYKDPSKGSVPVQFSGLYPRTDWYREPERYGFKLKDPSSYLEHMINYKIKLLFPPQYWDPLPYTIDGKSYDEFSKETMEMIGELENIGITTSVSDEVALIGILAGFSPNEYGSRARANFYCGDYKAIEEEVKVINSSSARGKYPEKVTSNTAPDRNIILPPSSSRSAGRSIFFIIVIILLLARAIAAK